MSANIPALVEAIARSLADDPGAVRVEEIAKGRRRVVQLTVAPADLGRIIGREGRVANAIRSVLSAAAADEAWGLEIAG